MGIVERNRGFSLVELLTVIAIIAILAAIIFPVMATVKDRARQSQCLTNLQQIAQAIQVFKLDNRRYPEILGSPVRLPGTGKNLGPIWPGDGDPEMFENVKDQYLFAEYIKTIAGFHCPSSKVTNSRDAIVHYKAVGGAAAASYLPVYAYDSYDAVVVGGGQPMPPGPDPPPTYVKYDEGAGTAAPHYLLRWADQESDVGSLPPYPPPKPGDPNYDNDRIRGQDYERQLRWRNPPGDTIITWCSYHEGTDLGGRCPVVFLDGHADAMPAIEVEACRWRTRPKKS